MASSQLPAFFSSLTDLNFSSLWTEQKAIYMMTSGGGGDCGVKRSGMVVGIFQNTPKRVWLRKFFISTRYQNHEFQCYSTPKRYQKVRIWKISYLKIPNRWFLPLEDTTSIPDRLPSEPPPPPLGDDVEYHHHYQNALPTFLLYRN